MASFKSGISWRSWSSAAWLKIQNVVGSRVTQLAGLAPLVSQAARAGDAVAQDILRRAGERLSETVCAVIRGLNMTDEAFEVVLTGGVLQARDVVRATVVAALGQVAPQAQVIEPQHGAAVGAALLARQRGA